MKLLPYEWLMTCLLLLASYEHGTRRLRPNNKQRLALRLPQPTWFRELIAQENLQPQVEHRVPLRDGALERFVGARILGVVAVRRGQACDGILTPWTKQERLLWEYHEQRPDMISFDITAVWRLQTPVLVMSAKTKSTRGGIARVSSSTVSPSTHALFIPSQSVLQAHTVLQTKDGEERAFHEVLRDVAEDGDWLAEAPMQMVTQSLPCTWLVAPVLELVLRGHWRALLLSPFAPQSALPMSVVWRALQWPDDSTWARLEEVYLAGRSCTESAARSLGQPIIAPADAFLREQDVCFISDLLRQHAPHIIAATQSDHGDDAADMRMRLQGTVATLDAMAKTWQPPEPLRLLPRGAGVTESEAQRLICALQLCYRLRNRDSIQDSMDLMMQALLPPAHIQAVRQSIRRIPSAGTVSKIQLRVDAALSMVWRDKLASSCGPVYLWLDSSPQAGTDWLLSMFDFVDLLNVGKTATAARELQSSTGRLLQAVSVACSDKKNDQNNQEMDEGRAVLQIIQARCSAAKTLVANVHRHHQIPFCIGAGAGTLEHKCRAIAQKSLAECSDITGLHSFLARVVAIVVDMGVERGVADAQGGCGADYLPTWLRSLPRSLSADEGFSMQQMAPMLAAREERVWSPIAAPQKKTFGVGMVVLVECRPPGPEAETLRLLAVAIF